MASRGPFATASYRTCKLWESLPGPCVPRPSEGSGGLISHAFRRFPVPSVPVRRTKLDFCPDSRIGPLVFFSSTMATGRREAGAFVCPPRPTALRLSCLVLDGHLSRKRLPSLPLENLFRGHLFRCSFSVITLLPPFAFHPSAWTAFCFDVRCNPPLCDVGRLTFPPSPPQPSLSSVSVRLYFASSTRIWTRWPAPPCPSF